MCFEMISQLKERLLTLLRWSEKYTKTDMRYLFSGGSWLTLGHAVSVISTFALSILFANLLPKDIFGTYKYILSIAGILTIATLPGINTYLAQAVARGFERTIFPALRIKIMWGFLGAAIALIGTAYYFIRDNNVLSLSLFIVALFIPFMDSLSIYNTYLQSKKYFKESIFFFARNQILATIAIATALFFTDNIFIILSTYFGIWVFLRGITFHRVMKLYNPKGESDTQIASYGLHLSAISLFGIVAMHIDSLLIFQQLGAVEVALYAFALAPVEQVRGLYKNIAPLALPKLAKRTCREINALLGPRLILLFVMGLVSAILYVMLVPYLFKFLFPQYLDAIFFSQLLAGLIALGLPSAFFASVMQSKVSLMPRAWFYWGTAPYIVLIALLFVLIPMYGIVGVIIAKYASLIVGALVNGTQWRMLSAQGV